MCSSVSNPNFLLQKPFAHRTNSCIKFSTFLKYFAVFILLLLKSGCSDNSVCCLLWKRPLLPWISTLFCLIKLNNKWHSIWTLCILICLYFCVVSLRFALVDLWRHCQEVCWKMNTTWRSISLPTFSRKLLTWVFKCVCVCVCVCVCEGNGNNDNQMHSDRPHSMKVSSVQGGICAHGKAFMHLVPSLRSVPSIVFESFPMIVWLTIVLSHHFKEGQYW